MENNQDAFFRELLADFKVESAEHRQAITNGLLLLEKTREPKIYQEIVETTFREFHSLKGAARAVSQLDIERLCQVCESVFHRIKQDKSFIDPPLFELMYRVVDMLGVMLNELDSPVKSISQGLLGSIIRAIDATLLQTANRHVTNLSTQSTEESVKVASAESIAGEISESLALNSVVIENPVQAETIRISISKLNSLLRQSEEFISVKGEFLHLIEIIKSLKRPELQAVEREMVRFNASFSQMVDKLLYEVKSAMLYPFSTYLDIVPKIVRDLGKEYNKEIRLSITGASIEIDRRILEGMKDPLLHLIRNCIDHGIETPEERLSNGKPAQGNISIEVRQDSGRQVDLIITDDGRGINPGKVAEKAIKTGMLTQEAASEMTGRELQALIFKSGFSTSSIITDISGRGLGMAIVAEKVAGLGGTIHLLSTEGKGTSFTIQLPLTLSTFRGIKVRVANHIFVIPVGSVERVVNVNTEDLKTIGTASYLSIDNEHIGLKSMSKALGIAERGFQKPDRSRLSLIIISHTGLKVAFIVDEIMGELEGVVKELGPQLVHLNYISGATIAGNGSVILIIDIAGIMKSSLQSVDIPGQISGVTEGDEKQGPKTILIAEDSITSRTLLRNIIESAGYNVRTAVNGAEAFKLLLNEPADLVVSDVEMPHMNGFELTSMLRSNERFRDLPVILVTALSNSVDKQRGLDSGANAYIVKGSFEQTILLETISRLI